MSPATDPAASDLPTLSLPSKVAAQVDLLVSLHLWAWPALTFAVQNAWGGSPQISVDKRDWFASAVSELITSQPPQVHDVEDLEEVLLQVMNDEFEVVVDDESGEEIARKIWTGLKQLRNGDTSELETLYNIWQEKQSKAADNNTTRIVRGKDYDAAETDWDDDDDHDDDDDDDYDGNKEEEARKGRKEPNDQMDIVTNKPPVTHAVSQSKLRTQPETDEDGFTKVVAKRRR